MKTSKILSNGYVKCALFAGLIVPVVIAQVNYDKDVIEKAKKEIKMKDPQRFSRLKKQAEDGKMSKFSWKEECEKMNDSLRIDSISKKAYFEGAQMVRDSIANAKIK